MRWPGGCAAAVWDGPGEGWANLTGKGKNYMVSGRAELHKQAEMSLFVIELHDVTGLDGGVHMHRQNQVLPGGRARYAPAGNGEVKS
jgi:hypothetical protein